MKNVSSSSGQPRELSVQQVAPPVAQQSQFSIPQTAAASSAAASSKPTLTPVTFPKSKPRGPVPLFSVLDKHARPSAAAAAAEAEGKKRKKPLVKPVYRFPKNRACDIITNIEDEEDAERLALLSRLERYAEAFPEKNVDPCVGWDLDITELRAYVRSTQERLTDSRPSSWIGVLLYAITDQVEARVPDARGSTEILGHTLQENADLIKVVECDLAGTIKMPPAAQLAVALLLPLGINFVQNRKQRLQQQAQPQVAGPSVASQRPPAATPSKAAE